MLQGLRIALRCVSLAVPLVLCGTAAVASADEPAPARPWQFPISLGVGQVRAEIVPSDTGVAEGAVHSTTVTLDAGVRRRFARSRLRYGISLRAQYMATIAQAPGSMRFDGARDGSTRLLALPFSLTYAGVMDVGITAGPFRWRGGFTADEGSRVRLKESGLHVGAQLGREWPVGGCSIGGALRLEYYRGWRPPREYSESWRVFGASLVAIGHCGS